VQEEVLLPSLEPITSLLVLVLVVLIPVEGVILLLGFVQEIETSMEIVIPSLDAMLENIM